MRAPPRWACGRRRRAPTSSPAAAAAAERPKARRSSATSSWVKPSECRYTMRKCRNSSKFSSPSPSTSAVSKASPITAERGRKPIADIRSLSSRTETPPLPSPSNLLKTSWKCLHSCLAYFSTKLRNSSKPKSLNAVTSRASLSTSSSEGTMYPRCLSNSARSWRSTSWLYGARKRLKAARIVATSTSEKGGPFAFSGIRAKRSVKLGSPSPLLSSSAADISSGTSMMAGSPLPAARRLDGAASVDDLATGPRTVG
mmetsp:Transcript_87273/g.242070  ORF Transcript_87273/g.242070 Transcript_87273/m.242070 type:complete len:256 (-) Transcript_87273:1016-1783(-)